MNSLDVSNLIIKEDTHAKEGFLTRKSSYFYRAQKVKCLPKSIKKIKSRFFPEIFLY